MSLIKRLTCFAEEVYFGKARDIVGDLRSMLFSGWILDHWTDADALVGIQPLTEANKDKATHQEMINSMKR